MVHSDSRQDFNKKILELVENFFSSGDCDSSFVRVLLAGHSLGGAVGQVAANDSRKHCGIDSSQVSVYNFGCPRIGNYAFGLGCEAAVPNAGHIVNALNALARTPKLWFMYKRAGRRVIINSMDDIIVDPCFLEFRLASLYEGIVKIADQLLYSYRKSLKSIVRAFITHKGLLVGMEGMLDLFKKDQLACLLAVCESKMKRSASLSHDVWLRNHTIKEKIQALNGEVAQLSFTVLVLLAR